MSPRAVTGQAAGNSPSGGSFAVTLSGGVAKARVAFAALAIFAVCWGGWAASTDLNTDQAISSLAALRHLAGQAVYGEFSEPHGPIAGWLLAGVLWLAPTGGWAFVAASALLNLAAVWLVWALVRRAAGDDTVALQAAAVTACWFVAPFGGYYHDLLAYVFVLAAWWCDARLEARRGRALAVAACFVLALHTKQTVGAAGLLGFGVCRLLFDGVKATLAARLTWRMIGWFVALNAAVLLAIGATGELARYRFYALTLPAQFAASAEGDKSLLNLPLSFLAPYRVNLWHVLRHWQFVPRFYSLMVPCVALVFVAYVAIARRVRRGEFRARERALVLLVFLLLTTLWAAANLGRKPNDITLGTGGFVALALAGWAAPRVRWAVCAALCALAWPNVTALHSTALAADPFFATTDLRPIRIRPNAYQYDLAATRACVEFLRPRPGRLAVCDDAGFLVPLALGRAPWGPSGYYHFGLTVPSREPEQTAYAQEFVRLLDAEAVEFVLSVDGWPAEPFTPHRANSVGGRVVHGLLAANPALARAIGERYAPVFKAGGTTIQQRRR